MDDRARTGVFVSYSHRDKKWLELLQSVWYPLSKNRAIEIWSDKRIRPGAKWLDEISMVLSSCKVAILLVSPNFLASEFILNEELTPLLKRAQADGMSVLWIAVSSSMYKQSELSSFQAANDPDRPLDTLSPAKVNRALVTIGEALLKAAGASSDCPSPRQGQNGVPKNNELESLHFSVSAVAASALAGLGLSQDHLLATVRTEFISHPILARIDYELAPRPLSPSLFVLLTKRGSHVCVDHVGSQSLSQEKVEMWSALCQSYLRAYNLPFRTNHQCLFQETEFKRTMSAMKSLLEALSRYVYQAELYHDEKAYPNLHRLKHNAEESYLRADDLYQNFLSEPGVIALGLVALELDSIVSSAHKIAVEYRVRV